MCLRLGSLDVFGLKAFFAGDDVEVDFVTFIQSAEAVPLNGAIMNKNVLTGFLCDETKPMFIVEPLYFAAGHNALS